MTKRAHEWFREQIELLARAGNTEEANAMSFAYAAAVHLGRGGCETVDKLPEFAAKELQEHGGRKAA